MLELTETVLLTTNNTIHQNLKDFLMFSQHQQQPLYQQLHNQQQHQHQQDHQDQKDQHQNQLMKLHEQEESEQ